MENTRNTKKRNVILIVAVVILILLVAGVIMVMNGPAGAQGLSKAEATEVALKHANVNEADVDRIKTVKDFDDGMLEYEVEFVYDGYEYEYTIDGRDGVILEASRERTVFDF